MNTKNITKDKIKPTKQKIKARLEKYYLDIYALSSDDFQNTKDTLIVMNKILQGISLECWSNDLDDKLVVNYKRISIELFDGYENKRDSYHADLSVSDNNHTAWVKYSHKTKKFINHDIGGS